jgi:para-aminobenzoate synthetase/4-amino-4-deoxychorismate lyase
VVLDLDGALVTPPLACGLLDGVFRRYLLERGMLFERCVTPAMLRRADRVWLINSVRKWIPVELYLPVDGLGGTGASGHSVGVVKNG